MPVSLVDTIPACYSDIMPDFTNAQVELRDSIWGYFFEGLDWDIAYSVIECSSGGYAVVGLTYSYGAGGSDVLLLRLHDNGTLLWNKTFGGALDEIGYSIVECSDGGFAFVGSTTSFGAGGRDVWFVRTDAVGNHIWNHTFGGPNYDEAWSIVQRSDESFAIAGTYSHGIGGWDMWLILADANGQHNANYTYGGPLDELCYSMVECASGGFALGGFTESYGAGEYDYFLVRTDSDGLLLWNRTYGDSWFDEMGSLIECSSGGFALLGESTPSPGAVSDTWLVRTDDYGNQMWNMTYDFGFDDHRSYAITESDDNDLVFTSCHGPIVVVRVDENGKQIWAWKYEKELVNIAWSIIESTNRGFIVAGYTSQYVGGPKAHAYDALIIYVPDTPRWAIIPANQTVEYEVGFSYWLDAVVPHGIDEWWLGSFEYFNIDSEGVVRNNTIVPVGNHSIHVHLNDTFGAEIVGEFTVEVVDTKPPIWVEEPMDHTIKAGVFFRYDLNATDAAGIAKWDIDDKVNFDIDSDGVVTSNDPLKIGIYNLEVEVEDMHGNTLLGTFSVTVEAESETDEEIPWDLVIMVLGIGAVVSLIITFIIYRLRRRSSVSKSETSPVNQQGNN